MRCQALIPAAEETYLRCPLVDTLSRLQLCLDCHDPLHLYCLQRSILYITDTLSCSEWPKDESCGSTRVLIFHPRSQPFFRFPANVLSLLKLELYQFPKQMNSYPRRLLLRTAEGIRLCCYKNLDC
jgi:hypothetical protein